ncbi:MAG: 30S ribosomal protein S4 [Rikenellaceae bacterium]
MARYTGPKTRIARKFGEPIFGVDKSFEKKNFPPGQHGLARKRKKMSEYGTQLKEKQKTKAIYGILEKQFSNAFKAAARKGGVTGDNLLSILECRLDNVVYRLGIAPTRAAARQLVSHRHITVNGNVLNIPSYSVKPGELIGVRVKSQSLEVIQNSLGTGRTARFPWLEWDNQTLTGKFVSVPARADIPENINEQLIVELYSK